MTDLEYIQSENPQIKKVNFYFFEHALFRQEFLAKFKIQIEKKGIEYKVVDKDLLGLLRQDSLFGESCFVVTEESFPEQIDKVMAIVSSESFSNRILFVLNKAESAYKKNERLFAECKVGRVFEEIQYAKNTYMSLFAYYLSLNKIAPERIANYPLLMTSLENIFSKCDTIFEYWSKVDFVFNSCIDKMGEATYSFDISLCKKLLPEIKKPEYFKTHEKLYSFLSHPESNSILALFEHAQELCEEGTSRKAIDSLYRGTFDLISVNASFQGKTPEFSEFKTKILSRYASIPLHNLFQFIVRFSEQEPRLNRGDFPTTFHKFLLEIAKVIK